MHAIVLTVPGRIAYEWRDFGTKIQIKECYDDNQNPIQGVRELQLGANCVVNGEQYPNQAMSVLDSNDSIIWLYK